MDSNTVPRVMNTAKGPKHVYADNDILFPPYNLLIRELQNNAPSLKAAIKPRLDWTQWTNAKTKKKGGKTKNAKTKNAKTKNAKTKNAQTPKTFMKVKKVMKVHKGKKDQRQKGGNTNNAKKEAAKKKRPLSTASASSSPSKKFKKDQR